MTTGLIELSHSSRSPEFYLGCSDLPVWPSQGLSGTFYTPLCFEGGLWGLRQAFLRVVFSIFPETIHPPGDSGCFKRKPFKLEPGCQKTLNHGLLRISEGSISIITQFFPQPFSKRVFVFSYYPIRRQAPKGRAQVWRADRQITPAPSTAPGPQKVLRNIVDV